MTTITIRFPDHTPAAALGPIHKAVAEVAGVLGCAVESNGRVDRFRGIEIGLVRRDLPEPAERKVVPLFKTAPRRGPQAPMPPQAA